MNVLYSRAMNVWITPCKQFCMNTRYYSIPIVAIDIKRPDEILAGHAPSHSQVSTAYECSLK
jgi:hypothetical protein